MTTIASELESELASVLDGGSSIEERQSRLAGGAEALAAGGERGGLFDRQRILLTAAASLMTIGVAAIVLGWLGAAHALIVEEQLPYLISGGLLGLALAIIGAVTLFTHWLTVLVHENRRQHHELVQELRALGSRLDERLEEADGRTGSARAQRPVRRAPRRS